MSLYQTDDFNEALRAIRVDCHHFAVITRSEKGSVVVTRDETFATPAMQADNLVDTTGAGDLYAAGFIYGYTHERPLRDCARFGSLAAHLVIQQIGPRPHLSLRQAAIAESLL